MYAWLSLWCSVEIIVGCELKPIIFSWGRNFSKSYLQNYQYFDTSVTIATPKKKISKKIYIYVKALSISIICYKFERILLNTYKVIEQNAVNWIDHDNLRRNKSVPMATPVE